MSIGLLPEGQPNPGGLPSSTVFRQFHSLSLSSYVCPPQPLSLSLTPHDTYVFPFESVVKTPHFFCFTHISLHFL